MNSPLIWHVYPGHLDDHSVEDIIEKVACQFAAHHTIGRPRAPYWYPGWPLYVCDSQYNEHERVFVKIKDWDSCIPEEVRKNSTLMSIYPFERNVYPKKLSSPFLSRSGKNSGLVKGPGGIDESVGMVETTEKVEGDGDGKKRQKKAGATSNVGADPLNRWSHAGVPIGNANAAGYGHYPYQPSQLSQQVQSHRPQAGGVGRSGGGTSGSLVSLESHASIEKLAPEIGEHTFFMIDCAALWAFRLFFT
jgi:chromatin structure-remodeling complex subunit RSC1/2